MIKKDGIFLLIIAACASIVLMACNRQRDPCLQPKTVVVRMNCTRHADTGTVIIDTALPNLIAGAIDIDSPIFFIVGAKKVSQFPIILSPERDSCSWFIQPDSAASLIDTLTFYYSRKLQFLSNACGYTYFFSLESIKNTRHGIDSVKIINSSVTSNASIQHVQILY